MIGLLIIEKILCSRTIYYKFSDQLNENGLGEQNNVKPWIFLNLI